VKKLPPFAAGSEWNAWTCSAPPCAADSSLEEKMSELPRIVGLRNRLIHGYDSVDDEIIWDIVQSKIPPLAQQLEAELRAAGYSV
jgi:hypothetical protein